MKWSAIVAVIAVLTLTSCDNSVDDKTRIDNEESISVAEAFIDAFYSFDSIALEAALSFDREHRTAGPGWSLGT